jgi:hypothetical protein
VSQDWIDFVKQSRYYQEVADFYRGRTAERSGVPLIQHIDEGLTIIDRAGGSVGTMQAYCLHPLFQSDQVLASSGVALINKWHSTGFPSANVMMLVMEYRQQANAWLSDKVTLEEVRDWIPTPGPQPDPGYRPLIKGKPTPGPLGEVRMMLIGDKVQNRKDFMRYHFDTHPRSKELDHYFMLWLKALGVSREQYNRLVEGL